MVGILVGIFLVVITAFVVRLLLSQRVDVDEVRKRTIGMTPEEKKKYDAETVKEYISWTNKPFIFIIPLVIIFSAIGFFNTKELLRFNSFGIPENLSYVWIVLGIIVTSSLLFNIHFEHLRSTALFHAQNNHRKGWWAIMMYTGAIGVLIYRHMYMKKDEEI